MGGVKFASIEVWVIFLEVHCALHLSFAYNILCQLWCVPINSVCIFGLMLVLQPYLLNKAYF